MSTQSDLSNAIESDFRAIASQSRAAELKRLWKALWNINIRGSGGTESHSAAPVSTRVAEAPCARTFNNEQLPKAA